MGLDPKGHLDCSQGLIAVDPVDHTVVDPGHIVAVGHIAGLVVADHIDLDRRSVAGRVGSLLADVADRHIRFVDVADLPVNSQVPLEHRSPVDRSLLVDRTVAGRHSLAGLAGHIGLAGCTDRMGRTL